jgi:chorismate mutase
VRADANTADAILDSTRQLMRELLERNQLDPSRIVSCIFTCTDDLDAEFPAVAARAAGLDSVPLLCTRELNVPGAMERVIRVLVHYYAPAGQEPVHAYLGEAQALRSDLQAAQ